MNIKNEKGEMFTLAALALVGVISLFVGMVIMNPIKSVFGFGSGGGSKVKQSYITKTESHPIFVKGEDGKTYMLTESTTTTSSSDENEQPKLSLWQRLMILPKLWLLLMILGLFCAPVAAFMAWINRGLKTAAVQMVSGIEHGLAQISTTSPVAKQTLLDTMSKKYDTATKALVNKIKTELNGG